MRVFVLCTGRSGSTTFASACEHITNYSSGHETQPRRVEGRLDYPDEHIEVDHRLSWFLGSLDRMYGDDPVYVHLTRDPDVVAESWSVRHNSGGQLPTWLDVVLYRPKPDDRSNALPGARLMVQTVTDNIELFMRDKSKVFRLDIEDPHDEFDRMWDMIGAEGNRDGAHTTLRGRLNARRR